MAMDMNVALKISAGVTGQQAVDQLRTSMDKLNGAATSVSNGFKFAGAAVGAFIGLQAVQEIVRIGGAMINAADQMDEMAERTGMSVESLSQLQYAAKIAGTDINTVEGALAKLSAKAVDAASGNKTAAVAFDALGVAVQNADGSMRSSIDIMADVGDQLSEITDATLRTAVAREVFGKSGDAILPFAMRVRELRGEAEQLGATMSGRFATQAAEFNDNLDRSSALLSSMGRTVMGELLPGMNALAESFVKTGQSGGALNVMAEGLAVVFETIVVLGGNVVYVFKQIGAEAIGIGKQMAALATLDFDAFNRIGAQMKTDAAQARKEIDAWSESILNARKNASAGAGRGFVNPEANNAANQRAVDILNKLGTANKQVGDTEKERTSMMQGLNDEVQKMIVGEDQLFIAKLRRLGATDKEIAQAEEQLRQRAQLKAADRELEDATKTQIKLDEDAKRSKEQLAEAGKRVYEETRTPAEKLNIELARLNDLLRQGVIDWDTYERATNKAQDAFEDAGKKGKDVFDELKNAVEGWGRQATDTFVDFAFGAKASFGDLVTSILKDMARMLIQTQIMAPLMQAARGYFGFANGGIMTDSGPMPLRTYAAGGIANSPQVAIYGEGRMPEAYVPLPDGRTIPVTMKGDMGGGGVNNVTVNVSVENGGDKVTGDQGADNLGRVIANVVKSELINQKRPGGLLA